MAQEARKARRGRDTAFGEKVPSRGFGHWFTKMSSITANLVGSPWAFLLAAGVIIVWAVTGPIFGFSSDWQLVINTGTTIVTFLMVFLIQNTQNRDAKAIHLKLDELLRADPRARNEFMEAEEEDLDEIVREKQIVDASDPAPPENSVRHRSTGAHARTGNGKPRA